MSGRKLLDPTTYVIIKKSAVSGLCERKYNKQTRANMLNRDWFSVKPKQLFSLQERTDLKVLHCSWLSCSSGTSIMCEAGNGESGREWNYFLRFDRQYQLWEGGREEEKGWHRGPSLSAMCWTLVSKACHAIGDFLNLVIGHEIRKPCYWTGTCWVKISARKQVILSGDRQGFPQSFLAI